MKTILLILSLQLNSFPVQNAHAAAAPRSGCIEFSTTTVESEECTQLVCQETTKSGSCRLWHCGRTRKKKYVDQQATGCSRFSNCGRNFIFIQGTPEEPVTDSTEQCDWRPCTEYDSETGACEDYQCVSKRNVNTETTVYASARCVKPSAQFQAVPAVLIDNSIHPTPLKGQVQSGKPAW